MPRATVTGKRIGAIGAAIGVLLAFSVGCTGRSGDDPARLARKDLAEASPLAELLGTPARNHRGLPQLDTSEQERQDTLTELVADCMSAAGFEYEPVPLVERVGASLLAAYALAPEQFAQEFGYGAATIEVEPYHDPNQELREALPADRQAEYDQTLWGEPGAGGGCYLQASAEVYGDPAAREAGYAEFDSLIEQINLLYQEIDADPRLLEAHRRWSQCLTEAGYPGFTVPADARRSVFDQLPTEPDPEQPDPEPGSNPVDPARLAEVRQYELTLAPVDYECQRQHVLGPRRLVTMERERAFIDANRAELERYRDWLADPRSG